MGNRLYVGNLPYSVTELDLRDLWEVETPDLDGHTNGAPEEATAEPSILAGQP